MSEWLLVYLWLIGLTNCIRFFLFKVFFVSAVSSEILQIIIHLVKNTNTIFFNYLTVIFFISYPDYWLCLFFLTLNSWGWLNVLSWEKGRSYWKKKKMSSFRGHEFAVTLMPERIKAFAQYVLSIWVKAGRVEFGLLANCCFLQL